MHLNRKTYSLPDYQKKLRASAFKLGVVCEHSESGKFTIFRPIPNCPWLPESRKKYFGKLRRRLDSTVNVKKYTFCTLTYSRKKYSNIEVARRIKHDIDLFFKRLGYRKSKPEYFYIVELTDNFMPHIHLIFDRYVHKKKVFTSWFKVTGSIMSRIQFVPAKNMVWYVTKYLMDAKKQSEAKWMWIFKNIDRIWSSSRNFFKVNPDYKSAYEFYFTVFDKNNALLQYFEDMKRSAKSREISPEETELLLLYAEKDLDLALILFRSYKQDFKKVVTKIEGMFEIPSPMLAVQSEFAIQCY